jgi:[NiFe] hydrogenase assembly HybE family chaperone
LRTEGENPGAALERVFAGIAATRMAGLPMNNPALRVEAVDFRDWHGVWVGVLITPWAINLMLLPGPGGGVRALGPDEKQRWRFPSGEYEFMGGHDEELGAYQSCSLFSPAFEFAAHEDARTMAEATMHGLMSAVETAAPAAAVVRADDAPVDRSLSRRGFLRGAWGRRS